MRLGPEPEVEEAPGQFWKDFIRDTAPVFRTPTIEQLESFVAPTWQALIDGAKYVNGRLVEIIELPGHPWFVASQFHPEFKSRPTRPAPLFREFVSAALQRARVRSGVAGVYRAVPTET